MDAAVHTAGNLQYSLLIHVQCLPKKKKKNDGNTVAWFGPPYNEQ